MVSTLNALLLTINCGVNLLSNTFSIEIAQFGAHDVWLGDFREMGVRAKNITYSRLHGINNFPSSIHRPAPEEAKKWATSFESVLKHKFGVQLFQDFLRSQYGEENLNFWLAVEEYKNTDDNTRAEKARVIYEDYVSTLSPTEVS